MNILPKKNWHVRTKANIERVRRDEAKAAEEAKETDRRIRLAEQEARTSLLRDRARTRMLGAGGGGGGEPLAADSADTRGAGQLQDTREAGQLQDQRPDTGAVTDGSGHVNFFQQLESGEAADGRTNKEHEDEKKKEQEEYEKKVGYLTYLGQDTEELTGEQVWWKKLPINRKEESTAEASKDGVGLKQKDFLDPLGDLKKYLKCDGVRLTLQKYERKKEDTEKKALNFEPIVKKLKRKRRSRSSSSSSSSSSSRRSKKKHKRNSNLSSRERKSSKKKRKKEKAKKRKHSRRDSDSDSDDNRRNEAKFNLEKLRRERLEREKIEREKADRVVFGEPVEIKSKEEQLKSKEQRYSSQFNPDIARQNKLDPKKKYWLE